MEYFRNQAVTITYVSARVSYIRLQWHPVRMAAPELREVYEHVLKAMRYSSTTKLLSLHGQRPQLAAEILTWIGKDWIPRAIAQVGYDQCAVVEADQPLSRLAAQSIGNELGPTLRFAYFPTEAAAHAWLTASLPAT